jgi:hypothetical protein
MSQSGETSDCLPLIEACTLELYHKNIFRITGLPVDATSKDVARQVQKLQMMEEHAGGMPVAAFPLVTPPTSQQIREALARMKEPEHRLVDEFFWYWPEKFGDSKNDPAIQAVLTGNAQKAVDVWVERENEGSFMAAHNLAIMFHMFAVDWTNYHVANNVDEMRDAKIRGYWKGAFDRWEELVDSDDLWDVMKERVRSLEDEALTVGFVRRMRKVLPQAFDRINAEAALKFAELGQMNWAKFHVDFMRQTNQGLDDVDSTAEMVLAPTKKRVEQRLRSTRERSEAHPEQGVSAASDLMAHCKPLMGLFDLFHGADSHQRGDLFDDVARTVADALVGYQRSTNDNKAFVDILQQALQFASGSQIRERLINNISIGENNLAGQQLEPFFKRLRQVTEGSGTPAQKLASLRATIIPELPKLAGQFGSTKAAYSNIINTVALALRDISIQAHNDYTDFVTATSALKLAMSFAGDPDIKKRLKDDSIALEDSKNNHKCVVCKVNAPDPSATLRMPIALFTGEDRLSLSSEDHKRGYVEAPRCLSCARKQEQQAKGTGSSCLVMALIPLVGIASLIVGAVKLF